MNIWKLSCNSVDGSPYFDDFLRTEKIVLDWEALDYKIGDIVLIAKEYTIIALAKVVGIKTQITENKEYEEQCKKYSIDYLDEVYYTPVEWIDLNENEYFQYELRQGNGQVRSAEIQTKANILKTLNIYSELWDKLMIEDLIDYQSDELLFTELAARGIPLDSSDKLISENESNEYDKEI